MSTEVTREEAATLALGGYLASEDYVGAVERMARTVVALYDDVETKQANLDQCALAIEAWRGQYADALECIDRLRDGWEPYRWESGAWVWLGHNLHAAPYAEPEPMTEAQQAVMAR